MKRFKSFLKEKIPAIFLVFHGINQLREDCVKKYYRMRGMKWLANKRYKETHHHDINWDDPQDVDEKIMYLMFYTDTSEWTRLADKYAVRDYVKEKGCEELLVPLLGKWNHSDEIDFDTLPNRFVLKSNHGSGDVVIVKDKKSVDTRIIRKKIQKALESDFGFDTAEIHYTRIKPCVFAEEYLDAGDVGLVDYKVWCFNGEPYGIFTGSERDVEKHTVLYNYFTLDWTRRDDYMSDHYRNTVYVPKPHHLDQMLKYAEILSEGFPEVRVDFYEINDKIYFGEMTFSSNSASQKFFTEELMLNMGKQFEVK